MAGSSQDSNSGVTGSEIHSPKRSCRVYAPGAGDDHDTSGGRAVIGAGLDDPQPPGGIDRPLHVLWRAGLAAITRAAIAMRRTSRP